MNKIKYKVFSHVDGVRQKTTTFDLRDVADVSTYDYIREKAYERFALYRVKINHVGLTIVIDYKDPSEFLDE